MCRLAYLHFDPSVSAERRTAAVKKVARTSWELGNTHGVGFVTWTPGSGTEPIAARALKLEALDTTCDFGTEVLVHARFSTNTISLANTHPFEIAGAYLVHNGIVCARSAEDEETFKAKAKTNNDSELILKAFLGSKRNLTEALGRIAGMSNVIVWDEAKSVLWLYADTADFPIYRQNGITVVCQEVAQTVGVIRGGMGHSYESDSLPSRKVVALPLKAPLADAEWDAAFEEAVKRGQKVKVPILNPKTTLPDSGSKGEWVKDGKYWVRSDSLGVPVYGIQYAGQGRYAVNGRVYRADGRPLERPYLSKSERKRLKKLAKKSGVSFTDKSGRAYDLDVADGWGTRADEEG